MRQVSLKFQNPAFLQQDHMLEVLRRWRQAQEDVEIIGVSESDIVGESPSELVGKLKKSDSLKLHENMEN